MYAKCGSMEETWRVFNKMPAQNVVSWDAMIFGNGKCGQAQKELQIFHRVQDEGVQPDSMNMGFLNAYASLVALEGGRHVHEQINQSGYEFDVSVVSSLIDMYAKCGSMEEALRVFNKIPSHDAVSCNVIILGHVKCEQGQKALNLFQQMQWEGVEPEPMTFVGVLNSCTSVAALEEGRRAQEQIIQRGCESDVFMGSSLVDMYAKCGSMEDALSVFNKMPS
jgi:pentatricopeptide repeat protein